MFGIIANVCNGDKLLRFNAKVYILYATGSNKPVVYGMAKWGKKTEKYIPFKRLTNFRTAFLPPQIVGRIENALLTRRIKETELYMSHDKTAFDELLPVMSSWGQNIIELRA